MGASAVTIPFVPIRVRSGRLAATAAAVCVLLLGGVLVAVTGAADPVPYVQPAAAKGAAVDQGYLRTRVLDVAVRVRATGAFDVRQRALEVSLETTNADTRTVTLDRLTEALVLKHPDNWKPDPQRAWAQAPGGGETQLLQPGEPTRVTLAFAIPDGPPPPRIGVVLLEFEHREDFFYGHEVWTEVADEKHGVPDGNGKPAHAIAAVVTLPVRIVR